VNNHITDTGRVHKEGCGIRVRGVGVRIASNTIHGVPRFGIMFEGVNHLIEKNHVYDAALETMDVAGIYGFAFEWNSSHGVVIRENLVHDIVGVSGKDGEWIQPFFAWGLYLDWACKGVVVERNIVARCPRAGIMVHDGQGNQILNNLIVDCGFGEHEPSGSGQIEFAGWTTDISYWQRQFETWCAEYDKMWSDPNWQKVESFRDPRSVPMESGHTMQKNRAAKNVLVWSDEEALAFNFRGLIHSENESDQNWLWNDGAEIQTAQSGIGKIHEPNLLGDSGAFETSPEASFPKGWSWQIRPGDGDLVETDPAFARSGTRGLALTANNDLLIESTEEWQRFPCVKTDFVPATPGATYRLSVWARSVGDPVPVDIAMHGSFDDPTRWQPVTLATVGSEWEEIELIAEYPEEASDIRVRLRVRSQDAQVQFDDVTLHRISPQTPWEAWQSLGHDQESRLGDPMILDRTGRGIRFSPDSPIHELGIEPLDGRDAGCFESPDRATWPLVTASAE